MRRRFFVLPLLAAATTLALAGTHESLHAQAIKSQEVTSEPKPITETTVPTNPPARPNVPARPNLHGWLMPGMTPVADNSYPTIATLTAHTDRSYAEVLDFYAKKLGASGYNLKELATFQPPNHTLLSNVGLTFDAASSCYVGSQIMNATLCRRHGRESVSVYLSTDRQTGETYISLTDMAP